MKMRNGMAAALCTVAALSLGGCITIGSSSISSKHGGTGRPISADFSDMGILRLTVPANFTRSANDALVGQCQSGKVTDVQTELQMRDFFIVQMYDDYVSGVCE